MAATQPNPIKQSSVPGLAIGDTQPQAGAPPYRYRGQWSGSVTYAQSDVVLHSDGKTYLSLQATNLAHTPSSSAAWWEVHSIS